MSDHKDIHFILDAEPTAAQQEHLQGWYKAHALEKWHCVLATHGNVTMLGAATEAMSSREARAAITQEGWRGLPPGTG
jgi:hypothetical protein